MNIAFKKNQRPIINVDCSRRHLLTFSIKFNFFKHKKESKSQCKLQPFPDFIEDVFHEPSAPLEHAREEENQIFSYHK